MAKNYTINQVILQQFSEDELMAMLPDVVVQFVRLIGLKQTLLLVEKLGGVDFYMPNGSQTGSYREQRLIDTVGEQASHALLRYFAGERLYIPRCDKLLRQARNRKFCDYVGQAVQAGMTKTQAVQGFAYEFGFSERYAYEVLKNAGMLNDKPEQQTNQLSLF